MPKAIHDGLTIKALRALIERQGYKCALTGDELRPDNCTLDHVVPLARGGEHSITNAQFILKEVNRAKNTMTTEEFVTMCRKVVAHADAEAKSAIVA